MHILHFNQFGGHKRSGDQTACKEADSQSRIVWWVELCCRKYGHNYKKISNTHVIHQLCVIFKRSATNVHGQFKKSKSIESE